MALNFPGSFQKSKGPSLWFSPGLWRGLECPPHAYLSPLLRDRQGYQKFLDRDASKGGASWRPCFCCCRGTRNVGQRRRLKCPMPMGGRYAMLGSWPSCLLGGSFEFVRAQRSNCIPCRVGWTIRDATARTQPITINTPTSFLHSLSERCFLKNLIKHPVCSSCSSWCLPKIYAIPPVLWLVPICSCGDLTDHPRTTIVIRFNTAWLGSSATFSASATS